MKKCIDCNKKISRRAERCRSCSKKNLFKNPNRHPMFKHGKNLVIVFCIDCNKKLCKRAFYFNVKRCKLCVGVFHKTQIIGKNNGRWIDGRTPLIRGLRQNSSYYKWRLQCLDRDNHVCQECGQSNVELEVDHINLFKEILSEFLNKYNQFSPLEDKETLLKLAINYKPFWDIKNGRTLCIKCHKIKTKKDFNKNRKEMYGKK